MGKAKRRMANVRWEADDRGQMADDECQVAEGDLQVAGGELKMGDEQREVQADGCDEREEQRANDRGKLRFGRGTRFSACH